jgi:hypothetical protein
MYGMGGGFGGMPYESPGSALVKGIEAGQGFMHRAQQEQDRRDQMAHERSREDRLDRMAQARQDFLERSELDKEHKDTWDRANKFHLEKQKDLQDMMSNLEADHQMDDGKGGRTVDRKALEADPIYLNQFLPQRNDWNKDEHGLRESLYRPTVEKGEARANQITADMQTGKVDPQNPDHAEDVAFWAAHHFFGDPNNVLAPPGGGPSQFGQHVSDLHSGMLDGDPQKIGGAMQGLYAAQIEAGRLGYMDHAAGTITSATLSPQPKALVASADGGSVIPALQLTGERPDGAVTNQQYAAPTKAPFDHPDNQELIHLDPKKVWDNIGARGAAHTVLQHPEVQENLRAHLQNPSEDLNDYAHSKTAVGNGNGTTFKTEEINGNIYTINTTKDGRELGRRLQGPATAKTEYEAREAALQRQVASGEKDQAEADRERVTGIQHTSQTAEGIKLDAARKLIGHPKPGGGVWSEDDINQGIAFGEKPAAQHVPSEAEAKAEGGFAEEHAMRALSITRGKDPDSGFERYTWSDDSAKGTPAAQAHKAGDPVGPKDMGRLQDAMLAARERAHRSSYGVGEPPPSTMPDPERDHVQSVLEQATKKYGNKYTPQQIIDEEIRLGHFQPSATRFYQSQQGPPAPGEPAPAAQPKQGINVTAAKPAAAPQAGGATAGWESDVRGPPAEGAGPAKNEGIVAEQKRMPRGGTPKTVYRVPGYDREFDDREAALRFKRNQAAADARERGIGIKPNPDDPSWRRADGSMKGTGYQGILPTDDGKVMSEKSIGIEIDGKEMDVPSIVPETTPEEIKYLQGGGDPRQRKAMVDKATAHAKARLKAGKSVWADQTGK